MIPVGITALAVGGKGNVSDVPVLGGLKADKGSLGKFFGPLRRPQARPGECNGGGIGVDAIWYVQTGNFVVTGQHSGRLHTRVIQTVPMHMDT